MAEQPKENALPSLVADDLVDLVRKTAGDPHRPLSIEYEHDDGSTETLAATLTSGRAAAWDYAILELLVEIRDSLADGGVARLAHVHVGEKPKAAPILGDQDVAILGDRIAAALSSLLWLDAGRQAVILENVEFAITRFLREKGIVR